MESHSPTSNIAISFVNTNSSFLLLEDGRSEYTMTVKNLSREKTVVINSVESENGAVKAELSRKTVLLPGEQTNIAVSANKPAFDTVTVSYSDIKNVFEKSEKSFGVTVLDEYSGKTAEDDMPENTKTPFIFRYIVKLINDLFAKIKSLFSF